MDFGKILRRKREEHNLTQADVAEHIGVSRQNVDSYESGYKIPPMRVVTRSLSSRQRKKQKNLRNIPKQSVQIVQAAVFLLMKRGIPS